MSMRTLPTFLICVVGAWVVVYDCMTSLHPPALETGWRADGEAKLTKEPALHLAWATQ